MKFHNITKDDMLNGNGLRVVLWVSGCSHQCNGCQNVITWNSDVGIDFDESAEQEIYNELEKDYIKGITFSGGDPLFYKNAETVLYIIKQIKKRFTNKDIWLYTGYTLEQLLNGTSDMDLIRKEILHNIDVLVDGKFCKNLADTSMHWAGSRNQNVITMKEVWEKLDED